MCIYDRTEEIEYNNMFEGVVFARGGGVYSVYRHVDSRSLRVSGCLCF